MLPGLCRHARMLPLGEPSLAHRDLSGVTSDEAYFFFFCAIASNGAQAFRTTDDRGRGPPSLRPTSHHLHAARVPQNKGIRPIHEQIAAARILSVAPVGRALRQFSPIFSAHQHAMTLEEETLPLSLFSPPPKSPDVSGQCMQAECSVGLLLPCSTPCIDGRRGEGQPVYVCTMCRQENRAARLQCAEKRQREERERDGKREGETNCPRVWWAYRKPYLLYFTFEFPGQKRPKV